MAAFGIMIYHCYSWLYGVPADDSFLRKWGVYGVSSFYILSGLTLYHVYFYRMKPSASDLKDFFLKRIFRIYPLLILVILLTVASNRHLPDLKLLFLNLTGLFGFFKWDGYIGTGVWSIGNELVFYTFFPIFVYLSKKNKVAFIAFSMLLLSAFIYFAFFNLHIDASLFNKDQWAIYVNPLNQVFLFLSGYLMGQYLTHMKFSSWVNISIFMIALIAFIFYVPVGLNLAAGINRVILFAASFLLCLAFYKNTFRLIPTVDNSLRFLGEASFSIYLLHPIVFIILKFIATVLKIQLSPIIHLSAAVAITLLSSYFCYTYFELYFIRLGKKVTGKINKPVAGEDEAAIRMATSGSANNV